jgi:hypothetical protein
VNLSETIQQLTELRDQHGRDLTIYNENDQPLIDVEYTDVHNPDGSTEPVIILCFDEEP